MTDSFSGRVLTSVTNSYKEKLFSGGSRKLRSKIRNKSFTGYLYWITKGLISVLDLVLIKDKLRNQRNIFMDIFKDY